MTTDDKYKKLRTITTGGLSRKVVDYLNENPDSENRDWESMGHNFSVLVKQFDAGGWPGLFAFCEKLLADREKAWREEERAKELAEEKERADKKAREAERGIDNNFWDRWQANKEAVKAELAKKGQQLRKVEGEWHLVALKKAGPSASEERLLELHLNETVPTIRQFREMKSEGREEWAAENPKLAKQLLGKNGISGVSVLAANKGYSLSKKAAKFFIGLLAGNEIRDISEDLEARRLRTCDPLPVAQKKFTDEGWDEMPLNLAKLRFKAETVERVSLYFSPEARSQREVVRDHHEMMREDSDYRFAYTKALLRGELADGFEWPGAPRRDRAASAEAAEEGQKDSER